MGQQNFGRCDLEIVTFVDPAFNIALNNRFCCNNSEHLFLSVDNVIDTDSDLKVLAQTLICEDQIRVYQLFNTGVQLDHI